MKLIHIFILGLMLSGCDRTLSRIITPDPQLI